MPERDASDYVANVQGFLMALEQNTDRPRLARERADYDSKVRRPTERLAESLSDFLWRLTGVPHSARVSRVSRGGRTDDQHATDTPRLHVLFAPDAVLEPAPEWALILSSDALHTRFGIKGFRGMALTEYRQSLATADGDRLAVILQTLVDQGAWLEAPALKRAPTGFPADHPHPDLLRRTGLVVWRAVSVPGDAADVDPAAATVEAFRRFKPLYDFLVPDGP